MLIKKNISLNSEKYDLSIYKFVSTYLLTFLFTHPIDIVKTLIQTEGVSAGKKFLSELSRMPLQLKLLHLYRGGLAAGMWVGATKTFDACVGTVLKEELNEIGVKPEYALLMGLGTSTALRYSLLFPFNTVLVRKLAGGISYGGIPQILQKEGISSFYRGYTPGVARTLVLTLATYPMLKIFKSEFGDVNGSVLNVITTNMLVASLYRLDEEKARRQCGVPNEREGGRCLESQRNAALHSRKPASTLTVRGLSARLLNRVKPRNPEGMAVAVLSGILYSTIFAAVDHMFSRVPQGDPQGDVQKSLKKNETKEEIKPGLPPMSNISPGWISQFVIPQFRKGSMARQVPVMRKAEYPLPESTITICGRKVDLKNPNHFPNRHLLLMHSQGMTSCNNINQKSLKFLKN